jgi:methionyl-tRNA formyltransferase
MAETLRGISAGTLTPRAQNHAEATYAPLLKKEDGRVDWKRPAAQIYNRMRGFTPWPGTYTTFRGRICHIVVEMVSKEVSPTATPGAIHLTNPGVAVTCGQATEVRVLSVKQEGGKQIDATEFTSSVQLTEGERFGAA